MIARYFYRNPLEAAYMNLNFGMKFTNGFFCEITVTKKGFFFPRELTFLRDDEEFAKRGIEKLYIHQISRHILEPEINDVLYHHTLNRYLKVVTDEEHEQEKYKHNEILAITVPLFTAEAAIILGDASIIKRNNIHFFWPEKEEQS